ncbi:MAG: hypothetical protein V4641_01845 [Pseudomonadota bacterium]
MNTTTQAEQNALTLPQRAAVALGSSKTEAELRALVKKSADIVEVNNMAGRDQAHRICMELRTTRVLIEKSAKTAREDATAFSKAVIVEEKRLVDIITPEEDRVLALRDGWDTKVETERQEKIAAEVARVAKIASAIEGIRERETDVIRICKTVAHTQDEIDHLEKLPITEATFQERFAEAVALKVTVLESMRTVLAGRVAAEAAEVARIAAAQAEKERIEAERAELAKLRADAAERERLAKIESDRIAAEQVAEAKRLAELAAAQEVEARVKAETAAADLRALAAAQAERARIEQAERDRTAAQVKAQLEQQAAALAAERKALDDERAADAKAKSDAAAAVEAKAKADALAELAAAQASTDGAELSPAAQALNEEQGAERFAAHHPRLAAAATTPPTLRLGQINERIAPLSISAEGLRYLGFEPAAKDRAAVLFHEHDFGNICAALQRHISAVQAKVAA